MKIIDLSGFRLAVRVEECVRLAGYPEVDGVKIRLGFCDMRWSRGDIRKVSWENLEDGEFSIPIASTLL